MIRRLPDVGLSFSRLSSTSSKKYMKRMGVDFLPPPSLSSLLLLSFFYLSKREEAGKDSELSSPSVNSVVFLRPLKKNRRRRRGEGELIFSLMVRGRQASRESTCDNEAVTKRRRRYVFEEMRRVIEIARDDASGKEGRGRFWRARGGEDNEKEDAVLAFCRE
jgi:hypothetical protein